VDHTLYHLAPKGFWRRFRDATVVNPWISSGLPLPNKHRYPQPASRTEVYATPATKASDPAQNPYWKRDARRQYPQLSVVTQNHLAQLLLASPEAQSAPTSEEPDSSVPAPATTAPELTSAIATITWAGKAFSTSNLPPSMPFKRWNTKRGEDAPHPPHAYFPMHMYTDANQ